MKTEALISKERAQAQQYLDVAGVMLAVLDKNGKINLINKKGCQILGYDENEILHQNWFDLCIHDDIREDIVGVFNELMTGNIESVEYFENPIITKSGEKKIIAFHNTLITDDDSNITGILFSGEDITERKKTEEALRQPERDLRLRNQINNIFLSYPDEEMYAEILKLIRKAMESKYGTFGYFDENGSFVAPAVTRKIYWDKCNVPDKNIIFKKGTFGGIWGRAIKERKTLISNDGPFNTPKGHIHIENTMVMPIIFHDEVISAIHLANKPNGYDEQDRTVLETIADQIAPVLYARLQRDRKDVQRKQAEEALRVSEEKYKALYDNAPLSYQSLNEDGSFNDVNPAWIRTLGYDRKEVIGKWFGDFLHPDWKPHLEKNFQEFKRRGYVHDVQFKIRHKDGHYLDISFEGYIGYNPDGSFKQTYCVFQDITERKQAEEALTNALGEWRVTFDSANDLIMMLDADFKIRRANLATERFLNRPIKEITGKTCYQLFHGTDRPPEGCPIENMRNTKKHEEKEFYLPEKNIWILVSVDPILDDKGNVTGAVHIIRDITERKRTEEEIRLHAAMMDNVAEGVYLIGLDDLIIKWTNEKFTRMFGYDPGEMVGKQVDIVNAPTEMTPTETRISIVDILKETGEWHGEIRNIKRDGTHFWCYANVSLFDHPEYGMVIVSAHTDITERKRTEAELLLKDLVFEHSIAANSISDNTGIIIHVNDTFIKIWGYESRNGAIEKPISDFLRFEDEEKKIITALHETGKWEGEFTALRKDGTTFSAYGLATIILDESGDIIGYQSAVLDITERKQDEEKLKASEDKYSTLVEKGNDGIIIIQDFVLKFVNSRMTELTGFTKEEAIGKPFYDYVSSEYKEMLMERVKKRLKGEAVPGKYEIDILSKDGSTIPVEINASLIEYEGRPADMAIIRDITERLQTEKDLQERMNELETFYRTTLGREERVIELKQEVNQLLEQLGKNMKYRDYSK